MSSKQHIESKCQVALQLVTEDCERLASRLLDKLAGNWLTRPEPLTVSEATELSSRLKVRGLAKIPASAGTVIDGLALGAFLGTLLLPGIGTVVGGVLGGSMFSKIGSVKPDVRAVCRNVAVAKWDVDSASVMNDILEQFELRIAGMKDEIARRLAAPALPPVAAELTQRERLQRAIISALADLAD